MNISDKEPCHRHSSTVIIISKDPDIYQCPRCGWYIGWSKGATHQSDDLEIVKIAVKP